MQEDLSKNIISYLQDKISHNDIDYENIISDLKSQLDEDEFIESFNLILENIKDTRLLDKTIREINKKRDKRNLSALIDFILKPVDDNLKVLAIKTISNYKDTNCLSSLMFCLNDKSSSTKVRLASAEALGTIGDRNAFDSLTNIVVDDSEKSTYVKESAVVALGMLGDNRALDVFDSILNTKQMFLDKFSYLKERIIEALPKFDISKDKKALKILKNSLLDHSEHLRIVAIETVMNSDFDCAYDLIYDRLLYDDSLEVRKNALVALYNISDRKILDNVALGDYPPELKQYAIELLEEYENE